MIIRKYETRCRSSSSGTCVKRLQRRLGIPLKHNRSQSDNIICNNTSFKSSKLLLPHDNLVGLLSEENLDQSSLMVHSDTEANGRNSTNSFEPGEIPTFKLIQPCKFSSENEQIDPPKMRIHSPTTQTESEYKCLETMYKAKISRLTQELRLAKLNMNVCQEVTENPDFLTVIKGDGAHVDFGEVDSKKVTHMQRENQDLSRILVQLRNRVQYLNKTESELIEKLRDAICTAETAKSRQTKAELTCHQLSKELEDSRERFEIALKKQADEHRQQLRAELNQLEAQLKHMRSALLMSEASAAEALERADHAEKKLNETMAVLEEKTRELKFAQQINVKEDLKIELANLKRKLESSNDQLLQVKNTLKANENNEEEIVRNLKSQLRDARDRAEKSETDLISSTEKQIRLIDRTNSLEQQLQQREKELVSTGDKHKTELQKTIQSSDARETELTKRLVELSKLHEDKMLKASSIIDQHRLMFLKLKEECQNGVELFDCTLDGLEKKQFYLMEKAMQAQKLVSCFEQERQRLLDETVDHLHQEDSLSQELTKLEKVVHSKDMKINQLLEIQNNLRNDLKILISEVKLCHSYLPQNERDRFVKCSYEVNEIISRLSDVEYL